MQEAVKLIIEKTAVKLILEKSDIFGFFAWIFLQQEIKIFLQYI